MKKLNKIRIIKTVSVLSSSSILLSSIFLMTGCPGDTKKSETKKDELKEEAKNIVRIIEEESTNGKISLRQTKDELKEGAKNIVRTIEEEESTNGKISLRQKKDELQQKNQLPGQIDEKSREHSLSVKTQNESHFEKIPKSPNVIRSSSQKKQNLEININFLNRLMYTKGEENYEKNKYSFQNRKYHNFDGLKYNLKTSPNSLNEKNQYDLGEDLLNSAPIYHMLYNDFSPISFFNRCKNGLANKTWQDIKNYEVEGETNKSDPKFEKMKILKSHIALWTKYFGDELIVKAIIEGITAQELIDKKYFQDQNAVNKWFYDLKKQIKLENEIKTNLKTSQLLSETLEGIANQNGDKIVINIGSYTFKIIPPSSHSAEQFRTLTYVKVAGEWKKLINQIVIKYKLDKINSNYKTNKLDIIYGNKFFTNDLFSNENPIVEIKNGDIVKFNTKNLNLFFHLLPIFKGFAKKDIESYGTWKGNTKTQIFETKTKSLWYWQNNPTRDGYVTGGKKGLIDVNLTPEMIMEPNFLFKENDIQWLYKNFNLTEFAKDNKNYKINTENKSLTDYFAENFSCLDAKLHSLETFIFLFKIAKWRLDILNSYALIIFDLKKDYSWVDGINKIKNKENLNSWFNYKVKTTTSIFEKYQFTKHKIIDFNNRRKIREFTETRFRRKNDASSK